MSLADEANELMDWKEPDPSQPELKRLLNYLVSISKENGQAHVILATSDYLLASWLSQGRLRCLDSLNFVVKIYSKK